MRLTGFMKGKRFLFIFKIDNPVFRGLDYPKKDKGKPEGKADKKRFPKGILKGLMVEKELYSGH